MHHHDQDHDDGDQDFLGQGTALVGMLNVFMESKGIIEAEAWRHVLGITCANDVTARDLQKGDVQWTRGKGFDTFCPLGPAIDTDLDPLEGLQVTCRVNGELRQSGSTADMIFGVAELIEYVSRIMTLLPGDVILTGTPSGVGPIEVGDRVEVEIEGIGVLMNPVVPRTRGEAQ